MSWYRQGSVALTNGSKVVSGSGTAWAANVQSGDAFHAPDGKTYEIDVVSADGSLLLADNYAGATASGQGYKIQPTQGRVRDLAAAVSTLITEYGSIESALSVQSGNVGVGTNSPAAKFVVSASGNSGYEVSPAGGIGGGPSIASYDRTAAAYKQVSHYAMAHMWWVGSAGRAMDLDTNGNLGLGVSAPEAKLHVYGPAKFSGSNPNRAVTINNSVWCRGETGSWSVGYRFLGNDGTDLGGFGALGTVSALNNLWIGADYNNAQIKISTSTAGTRLEVDPSGNIVTTLTDAAPTLGAARQMVLNRVSDAQVRISMRGADGTTRSVTLTLS